MIKKVLKNNEGYVTSLYQIAKFIEENYKVPETYRRYLRQALKRLEEKKIIIKVRASYKLSAKGKRGRSKSPSRKKRDTEKSPAKKKESPPLKKKRESPAKESPAKESRKEVSKRVSKEPSKKRSKETVSEKSTEGGSKVSIPESKYSHFWQYEESKSWKNYDVAASDTVEEVYQNYLSNKGDTDVRAVHSGSWEYQVDFMAMRQTNIQHQSHTSRNIRRVPNIHS